MIVKTGETFKSLKEIWGDFDDFIITQAELNKKNIIISAPYKGDELPSEEYISGVIITGSHSMMPEHEKWSEDIMVWLREIASYGIPILGICYGHQLIAEAFGGKVGYSSKGIEIGTVKINLTDEGKKDLLFSVLPNEFLGYATHTQTVIKLPEEAKLLAYNEHEPHHGFCIKDHIWGVQFHPEFNGEIMFNYIKEQEDSIIRWGASVRKVYNNVEEHVYGKMLLNKFIELVNSGLRTE